MLNLQELLMEHGTAMDKPVNVLLVDDTPANLLALEATIAGPNIAPVHAISGEEALRHLLQRDFALILLDVQMPGMDGFELAALIRARPNSQHTPIIFVTAHALDASQLHRGYASGAVDYIVKPFDAVVLRSKVAVFVELFRAAEIKQRAAALQAANRQLQADLAEQARLAAQIARAAAHDALTGLPNRSQFDERLRQELGSARRRREGLALLFMDLDSFKAINDTLGHDAGDELLKAVAARLKACVREHDIVARLGGDEFVLLLTATGDVKSAARVAAQVLSAFAPPFALPGRTLTVNLSVGIALSPGDGDDATTLIKNADIAMYRAKQDGGSSYRFCTPELTEQSRRRLALEHDLRRALERGEFVVHYQPRIALATGDLTGIEALIRWQCPERGLVLPDEFIPMTEESGLIVPIGEWVLRTACRQAREWRDAGLPPVTMAVNVSPRQLRSDRFLAAVEQVLDDTGLEPERLELEITESVAIYEAAEEMGALRRLKDRGVRIVIDDFGTGYSSFSFLRRFHADGIKIDRSFVQNLPSVSHDAGIAIAMIALANALGIGVIAEGVESEAQATFLGARGCAEIQGHHVSPPVTAEACAALLQKARFPVRKAQPAAA